MSIFTKVAVGAALALPMTAYVVGTLVSADSEPVRHDPIVLEYDVTESVSPAPPSSPAGSPSGSPSDDDGAGQDDGEGPEVVRADPDDLDEAEDDSSGPGSGDDRDGGPDDDSDDDRGEGGEERDDDDRDDADDRDDRDDD